MNMPPYAMNKYICMSIYDNFFYLVFTKCIKAIQA